MAKGFRQYFGNPSTLRQKLRAGFYYDLDENFDTGFGFLLF